MDNIETFQRTGDQITRKISLRSGAIAESSISAISSRNSDLGDMFDQAWLRAKTRPKINSGQTSLRTVDLFAGCGGLSVGIKEAARALEIKLDVIFANDIDSEVLKTFSRNFPEANVVSGPIEQFIDGSLGAPLTKAEKGLKAKIGSVDLLIGGPPCQGNSALNNHTRHADPKNELYLVMARFCEIFRPTHVVIENVPGVLSDRRMVAQRTWAHLEQLGYAVSSGVIDASKIGVAQRRKRSITLASTSIKPNVSAIHSEFASQPRGALWAIGDLVEAAPTNLMYDLPAGASEENRARIDYLFDNDVFNLPDEFRPDCHRLKTHSYKSVYGRIYPTLPAQTVTTGFGSMGRGRNVHPTLRRCITPHEAARIQFFPDFFQFHTTKRTTLQKMIGNAVPPKLGYAIGVHLLR